MSRTEPYRILVGNIGDVTGDQEARNKRKAIELYLEYVKMSRDGYGRAAGEPVVLMKGDEIIREHEGERSQED